jgi:hypothetical protein
VACKNDTSSSLRQRLSTELYLKLLKMGEKMLGMLQSMYGIETEVKLQCSISDATLKTKLWLTMLEVGD